MDHHKREDNGRCGRLPEKAYLANPYVPFQAENPPKYEARTGLVRGTLYPGLDLPFMGMVNKREKPVTPMTEMQALGFAIQELALYLDTHPEDKEALELYRSYQQIHHDCTMKFNAQCRPMTHFMPNDDHKFTWIHDPWPWEIAANKEG